MRTVCCLLAVFLLSPMFTLAAGPAVTVQTAGGETLEGSLSGLSAASVTLSIGNQPRELLAKDLLELRFPHQRSKPHLFGSAIFLANGDRLVAGPETIDDTQALARFEAFPYWESVKIPLETISGFILDVPEIAAVRSRNLRTVLGRKQNTDLVDLKNGDQAAGEFMGLSEKALTLSGPAGDTPISRENIRLVTMNRELISFPKTAQPAFLISMTDGSRITANRLTFDGKDQLSLEAAFGASFDLPTSAVISIRFLGGRAVYLSDLKPANYKHEPYLDAGWELKADRNVLGEPLRMDGVEYAKGLGMHSQSLVTYDLGGKYQSFRATIGLDDAAGDRGSVVFVVEVDGNEVFRSQPYTGRDKAIPLSPIPLAGAKQLTLKILFAEFGDVLDYANWCDAVLIQ